MSIFTILQQFINGKQKDFIITYIIEFKDF